METDAVVATGVKVGIDGRATIGVGAGVGVIISVGVLMGMGVNLDTITRGVDGSMSDSSCFILAEKLKLEPTEALTDVSSDGMIV